jgi:hypothetical protein
MIAPFIVLLSVVAIPRLLKRKVMKLCNDSGSGDKKAIFDAAMRRYEADKILQRQKRKVFPTPIIELNTDMANPDDKKTVVYEYDSKDPIDLGIKVEDMTDEQKGMLVARRNFILQDQYGKYMDLAIFDLDCCAQTIMAIVEEVGSSDFVTTQNGYKVVITKCEKKC